MTFSFQIKSNISEILTKCNYNLQVFPLNGAKRMSRNSRKISSRKVLTGSTAAIQCLMFFVSLITCKIYIEFRLLSKQYVPFSLEVNLLMYVTSADA